jgi:hypothetical protein
LNYGHIKNHKYPAWFSGKLNAYIKKKNNFRRRYQTDCFYGKFLFHRKSVKTTIKPDRVRCLKSADENLKCHPKQFWKYVSQFRKKNTDLLHHDMDGNKPRDIAETFSVGL